jgi:hypothetical protein
LQGPAVAADTWYSGVGLLELFSSCVTLIGNIPRHHFIGHLLRILIDLMHVVFQNAKDNYDYLSLVEIEHK